MLIVFITIIIFYLFHSMSHFSQSYWHAIIGYFHYNVVCLSVSLSVCDEDTKCIVSKRYILKQKCFNT